MSLETCLPPTLQRLVGMGLLCLLMLGCITTNRYDWNWRNGFGHECSFSYLGADPARSGDLGVS